MVTRASVCLRRLGGGQRSQEVRFGRFLRNGKVTIDRLIEGWSEQTGAAAIGRHVLAIQDTSEINFQTTPERRRGLGEIGKGVGRGVLVHAMLALDASTGSCLGLVSGRIWTRKGRVVVPHSQRPLSEKESERWVCTGETAKQVLAGAAMVTVIGDRESDIYPAWASLPGPNFHLILRVMHERCLVDGSSLSAASAAFAPADTQRVDLPARAPNSPARTAVLNLRFGEIALRRPDDSAYRHLPKSVSLTLVEVIESECPKNVEPVHWRLLTTHEVADAAAAWQIVAWYKRRWIIEQLFRLMKTQGLRLEDSQLDTADRLIKLAAIAAKAAAVTLQLLQARDGQSSEPATVGFPAQEITVLEAVNARVEGKTGLQKNPHPKHALAWAAWIIARLGGWDGYPSSKPPGPITFRYGLEHFRVILIGWGLRDVCMP
jgi:Transposase DDE domain